MGIFCYTSIVRVAGYNSTMVGDSRNTCCMLGWKQQDYSTGGQLDSRRAMYVRRRTLKPILLMTEASTGEICSYVSVLVRAAAFCWRLSIQLMLHPDSRAWQKSSGNVKQMHGFGFS